MSTAGAHSAVASGSRSVGHRPNAFSKRFIAVSISRSGSNAVKGRHSSVSFCELVLEQAGVVVSPGSSYGPNGEGYVRLSLTLSDERLREAMQRIEQHLRVAV